MTALATAGAEDAAFGGAFAAVLFLDSASLVLLVRRVGRRALYLVGLSGCASCFLLFLFVAAILHANNVFDDGSGDNFACGVRRNDIVKIS